MMDEKKLFVVESDPFAQSQQRRYIMLTEEERIAVKRANPELNVRMADDKEEMQHLCIHEDEMQERKASEGHEPLEPMTEQMRMKNYREAMSLVRDFSYQLRALSNPDYILLPNNRMIRWREAH